VNPQHRLERAPHAGLVQRHRRNDRHLALDSRIDNEAAASDLTDGLDQHADVGRLEIERVPRGIAVAGRNGRSRDDRPDGGAVLGRKLGGEQDQKGDQKESRHGGPGFLGVNER